MLQVDAILGDQPELKEQVFAVLKQYAAERRVECLACALCMLLTQESHQHLIDSIRYCLADVTHAVSLPGGAVGARDSAQGWGPTPTSWGAMVLLCWWSPRSPASLVPWQSVCVMET